MIFQELDFLYDCILVHFFPRFIYVLTMFFIFHSSNKIVHIPLLYYNMKGYFSYWFFITLIVHYLSKFCAVFHWNSDICLSFTQKKVQKAYAISYAYINVSIDSYILWRVRPMPPCFLSSFIIMHRIGWFYQLVLAATDIRHQCLILLETSIY